MHLLGKKVTDFDEAFICMLIEHKVAESRVLDYKLKFDISGDLNRLEFLRDITAFHNTEGGVLILGLQEVVVDKKKRGIPELPSTDMLTITNYEQTKSTISTALLTGTNPKVVGLTFSPLLDIDGRRVFAIGIPANPSIPSMVTYSQHGTFYKRNNTDKYMPDTNELFRAFIRHHTLQQEMDLFVQNRLVTFPAKPAKGLAGRGAALLHILPANFREHISIPQISTQEFRMECQKLFPCFGLNQKLTYAYTLEGMSLPQYSQAIHHAANNSVKPISGYTLLLRDGVIERANDDFFTHEDNRPQSVLYIHRFAEFLWQTVEAAFRYYALIDMTPQFYLTFSFIDLGGETHLVNGHAPVGTIEDSKFTLPLLYISDHEGAIQALGLLFDILWQACGEMACPTAFKETYFNVKTA